jgi:hypothetical protein
MRGAMWPTWLTETGISCDWITAIDVLHCDTVPGLVRFTVKLGRVVETVEALQSICINGRLPLDGLIGYRVYITIT